MASGLLDRRAELLEARPVVLRDDEDVASEAARAPEEVVLVGADRRRETESRPEQVDRPRLPVVVRKDGPPGPLGGRERGPDLRHVRGELRPAELVAEELREGPAVRDLGLRRCEAQGSGVGDVPLRREERERQRRRNGARGEEHRVGGGEVVVLPLHREQEDEEDREGGPEEPVGLQPAEREREKPPDPYRKEDRVVDLHLLQEKGERAEDDVLPGPGDV